MSRFIRSILILLYAFTFVLVVFQCNYLEVKSKELTQALITSRESVKYFQLRSGQYAAEKASYELTLDDYKKSVLRSRDSVKRLKERIGKLNNLVNNLSLQLAIQGDISAPLEDTTLVVNTDTISAKSIRYNDQWLELKGMVYPDTLVANYKVKTRLNVTTYLKGTGLFKAPQLTLNVVSDNPNLRVTEIENFHIRDKKPFYRTQGFAFATGLLSAFLILQ